MPPSETESGSTGDSEWESEDGAPDSPQASDGSSGSEEAPEQPHDPLKLTYDELVDVRWVPAAAHLHILQSYAA